MTNPYTFYKNAVFWSVLATVMWSCKENTPKSSTDPEWETRFIVHNNFEGPANTQQFKDYWYKGAAEISSYKLEQARYGEMRKGTAVLVFVTEDFLPDAQVKADQQNDHNIPVLKLNTTKNFNTGIYPYSIMQSTFFPVSNQHHAIKVTASIQEWCGQVYAQINNRNDFKVTLHSYFEGEADQSFSIEPAVLENELWTKLRIDPQSLPVGKLKIIPALEYTRLKHTPIKAYQAMASLTENQYTINYPELNRTLNIKFTPQFPYDILSWEETFKSGSGNKDTLLTTKATKMKTIKSAYWQKKRNEDEIFREILQLELTLF